jgi:hypothetical protein
MKTVRIDKTTVEFAKTTQKGKSDMKKEMSEFERAMNEEIEKRVSLLEQEEYEIVRPFNKTDWIFVGAAAVAGLGIILIGII